MKKEVSCRTIRRGLCSINMHGRVACKEQLLSKVNIAKRYEYAKAWVSYSKEEWERIIWSDETKISFFGLMERTVFVENLAKGMMKISYRLLNMEVEVSWFRLVFHLQE